MSEVHRDNLCHDFYRAFDHSRIVQHLHDIERKLPGIALTGRGTHYSCFRFVAQPFDLAVKVLTSSKLTLNEIKRLAADLDRLKAFRGEGIIPPFETLLSPTPSHSFVMVMPYVRVLSPQEKKTYLLSPVGCEELKHFQTTLSSLQLALRDVIQLGELSFKDRTYVLSIDWSDLERTNSHRTF